MLGTSLIIATVIYKDKKEIINIRFINVLDRFKLAINGHVINVRRNTVQCKLRRSQRWGHKLLHPAMFSFSEVFIRLTDGGKVTPNTSACRKVVVLCLYFYKYVKSVLNRTGVMMNRYT